MTLSFYHSCPRSPPTSSNSPPSIAQLFGGKTHLFLSLFTHGNSSYLSHFYMQRPTQLLTTLEHPRKLQDTSGHAPDLLKWPCRPYACSGARYSAPLRCSCPLPDASDHLGPPPHACRRASTSAARYTPVPLLLLPPPAPARTHASRPSAPVSKLTRAVPLAPLLSLFSPLALDRIQERPRHTATSSCDPL